MKAYFVPFRGGRCLALGVGGYRLKGPILYVPHRGAIFYESRVMGDVDKAGIVPGGVDFIEYRPMFLETIDQQIKGKDLGYPYNTESFNLSKDVSEIDVPEEEFEAIASEAIRAYETALRFRAKALNLAKGLEEKLKP